MKNINKHVILYIFTTIVGVIVVSFNSLKLIFGNLKRTLYESLSIIPKTESEQNIISGSVCNC